MEILIQVDLARIIGPPKGKDAVTQELLKRLPVNCGFEVGTSGYMILSAEPKE